ncbi:MAG: ATP-dependent DNA helicase [Fimbriimonas sp.]
MTPAQVLIERAFDVLAARPGYVARTDQRQLALLLSDLIDERATGAFEAPTGLGKSLAALIPAIAHGIVSGRRTVIATYTNVLAEQYWRKDLPLALALFEDAAKVKTQLLMGRSRYACLAAVEEHAPDLTQHVMARAGMGTENEFRAAVRKPVRELSTLWQKVSAPPVCPGRLCPAYDDCFYYNARKGAEKANVVITNHSVVLMDAVMKRSVEEGEGMIGDFDFLILDEAHDFPQAAINTLEFELSGPKLAALLGIAGRLEQSLVPIAQVAGNEADWRRHVVRFRGAIDLALRELGAYGAQLGRPGILDAAPAEVMDHPQVKNHRAASDAGAQAVADAVAEAVNEFVKGTERRVAEWRDEFPERGRQAGEAIRSYLGYLKEYAIGAMTMFDPKGVAVSYVGQAPTGPLLRQDVIDLAEPLRELVWERYPWACLSATLALDGSFDFFRRVTGAEPKFEEVLPSPFDFASQAALYLPPANRIPDPTVARKEGYEDVYFHALARELSEIIRTCEGRTLALFHSRREMDAVFSYLDLPPELPVFTQLKYGAAAVGERFKENVNASLFALRSFWTGFDAPGETLSCVVLVRVPFEVPIDPPQIARLAYLQTQGRDAFFEHSLPNAKMLMRQGAGRLVRRADDRGVIAILDPRVQTKRYGEDILANLPTEMRTYRDFADAAGWVGL